MQGTAGSSWKRSCPIQVGWNDQSQEAKVPAILCEPLACLLFPSGLIKASNQWIWAGFFSSTNNMSTQQSINLDHFWVALHCMNKLYISQVILSLCSFLFFGPPKKQVRQGWSALMITAHSCLQRPQIPTSNGPEAFWGTRRARIIMTLWSCWLTLIDPTHSWITSFYRSITVSVDLQPVRPCRDYWLFGPDGSGRTYALYINLGLGSRLEAVDPSLWPWANPCSRLQPMRLDTVQLFSWPE